MTTYKREVTSMSDLIAQATKPNDKRDTSRERGNASSYHGTASFDEALALAKDGWKEKRSEIDALVELAVVNVQQTVDLVPDFMFDVAGSDVDMGRFMTGDPENMIEYVWDEEVTSGKVVRILIDGAFSAGISTDTVFLWGASVIALVQVLATTGHNAEIVLQTGVKGKGDQWWLTHKVKPAEQNIDINDLAFCLGHPSYLRRFVLSIMENEPADIRRTFGFGSPYGWGYGAPIHGQWSQEADLYVPSPERNKKYGADWIIHQMRLLGMELVPK